MSSFFHQNRLATALGVVALVIAGLVAGGAAWHVRWSAAHLPALADDLGEVWMDRAARCEAAGDLEMALAHYEKALGGHFHGEQNRNHCQKRLGAVLYELGRYEEALTPLQEAQASPHRSLNGFAVLVDTLIALERWNEAEAVVLDWQAAAFGDTGAVELPQQALGRVALARGELAEARRWFEEAGIQAGADWARLQALEGNVDEARETMAAYLREAPPGEDTAENWALLEQWTDAVGL